MPKILVNHSLNRNWKVLFSFKLYGSVKLLPRQAFRTGLAQLVGFVNLMRVDVLCVIQPTLPS